LSERRAEAVKAELVKNGVPSAKISNVDVARAELVPTPDGVREPRNRRTEITLY
jgi:OOP family OmpA-OmpF porin